MFRVQSEHSDECTKSIFISKLLQMEVSDALGGGFHGSMEILFRDQKIVQTRRLRLFNSPAMLRSITSRASRSVTVLLTVSSWLCFLNFGKLFFSACVFISLRRYYQYLNPNWNRLNHFKYSRDFVTRIEQFLPSRYHVALVLRLRIDLVVLF